MRITKMIAQELLARLFEEVLDGGDVLSGNGGFGNVGVATARLMRAFGMKIYAINRRGRSDEPTDWAAAAGHEPPALASGVY